MKLYLRPPFPSFCSIQGANIWMFLFLVLPGPKDEFSEKWTALPGCISSCFLLSHSQKLETDLYVLAVKRTYKTKGMRGEGVECRRHIPACELSQGSGGGLCYFHTFLWLQASRVLRIDDRLSGILAFSLANFLSRSLSSTLSTFCYLKFCFTTLDNWSWGHCLSCRIGSSCHMEREPECL